MNSLGMHGSFTEDPPLPCSLRCMQCCCCSSWPRVHVNIQFMGSVLDAVLLLEHGVPCA